MQELLPVQVDNYQLETPPPPAAPAAAPEPLYESPASVNCHIMLEGRQIQLTLRDADETRLLERLATVLRQYPVLPSPTDKKAIKTSGETSDTGQPGSCQIHGAMKPSTKGKGWYCPVKLQDGSWCPSKGT